MGNATGLVVFYVMISLVSIVMTIGAYRLDPTSPRLFSSYLFGSSDPVGSQLNMTNGTYTFSNDLSSQNNLPTREYAGSPGNDPNVTPGTLFPDWVWAGAKWITSAGAFILNIVAAPYTLALMFGDPSLAAIIGASFAIINIFVFINWFIGRDN